jgi:hypothetical protein
MNWLTPVFYAATNIGLCRVASAHSRQVKAESLTINSVGQRPTKRNQPPPPSPNGAKSLSTVDYALSGLGYMRSLNNVGRCPTLLITLFQSDLAQWINLPNTTGQRHTNERKANAKL